MVQASKVILRTTDCTRSVPFGAAGRQLVRILFVSRPQFQGLQGATDLAVIERRGCVGSWWVRE